MHYTELAESVKHLKEKAGGREEMSEIVERYINERVEERVEERVKECVEERVKECVEERVKERVEKEKTISVQNLMNNMKWTLDQALDALGIKGKERTLITQQLQK
jgi:uncharacterized membrane protein YdbT with pleckstrin-like domain